MKHFEKLSRAEMKKIAGGGEHVCNTDNYCFIANPETRVLDSGPWCSVPDSGTGCQCFNPFYAGWDSFGNYYSGYGDVNYCYST